MGNFIIYFDGENYEVVKAKQWQRTEHLIIFRNDRSDIIAAFNFDNIIGICEEGYQETTENE